MLHCIMSAWFQGIICSTLSPGKWWRGHMVHSKSPSAQYQQKLWARGEPLLRVCESYRVTCLAIETASEQVEAANSNTWMPHAFLTCQLRRSTQSARLGGARQDSVSEIYELANSEIWSQFPFSSCVTMLSNGQKRGFAEHDDVTAKCTCVLP